MLSPDPLIGKRGYPLLLAAAGETADGIHPLVDRQHPHELLMELSAIWSAPLGDKMSGFVYAGLPGALEADYGGDPDGTMVFIRLVAGNWSGGSPGLGAAPGHAPILMSL